MYKNQKPYFMLMRSSTLLLNSNNWRKWEENRFKKVQKIMKKNYQNWL